MASSLSEGDLPRSHEERSLERIDSDITFIHDTADVSLDAEIGTGSLIWNWTKVRERAVSGSNVRIGQHVYIDHDVVIGDNCKIQNGANVFHGCDARRRCLHRARGDLHERPVSPDLWGLGRSQDHGRARGINWCERHHSLWCNAWRRLHGRRRLGGACGCRSRDVGSRQSCPRGWPCEAAHLVSRSDLPHAVALCGRRERLHGAKPRGWRRDGQNTHSGPGERCRASS